MQEGFFMRNVSSFNQPNITDEQFLEVDNNLVFMLYFTPEWCPKHFSKMAKVVSYAYSLCQCKGSEDDSKLDCI